MSAAQNSRKGHATVDGTGQPAVVPVTTTVTVIEVVPSGRGCVETKFHIRYDDATYHRPEKNRIEDRFAVRRRARRMPTASAANPSRLQTTALGDRAH